MKQPSRTGKRTKEERTQEAHALYTFFKEAETTQRHFTYNDIRAVFPRKNLTPYARRFWSWFLRNEQQKPGRPFTFSCRGLGKYPERYFVAAHMPHQGRYFYHFALAIVHPTPPPEPPQISPTPSSQEFTVPGQKTPEQLTFEDIPVEDSSEANVQEEDFTEESSPDDITEEPSLEEEVIIDRTPTAPSLVERFLTMLGISGKGQDALDHLRRMIEKLARDQEELLNDVRTIKQTLNGQLPNIPSSLEGLSKQYTSLVSHLETLQQTLEEQGQLHEGIAQTLTDQFGSVKQTLTEVSQRFSDLPDLPSIRSELDESSEDQRNRLLGVFQQSLTNSELPPLASILDLQQQVINLTQLVEQVAQRSSLSPNGQALSIPKSLKDASMEAQEAIKKFERIYATWHEKLEEYLKTMQQRRDDTQAMQQKQDEDLQTLIGHVSPDEKESQNGTRTSSEVGSQNGTDSSEEAESRDGADTSDGVDVQDSISASE